MSIQSSLSEVALIGLSALVGTFLWNHLSPLFNAWWDSGHPFSPRSLWDMAVKEAKWSPAWIVFLLLGLMLLGVVIWRNQVAINETKTAIRAETQAYTDKMQALIDRIDRLLATREAQDGTGTPTFAP